MTTPLLVIVALAGPVPTRRSQAGLGRGTVDRLVGGLSRRGFSTIDVGTAHVPEERMHRERRQYDSKFFLKMARERAKGLPDWHTKVLVLTDADIFATRSLFVVGQADVDGRAAVVSVARIASGDRARFEARLLKEALHELGHTLGLGHCRRRGCVMFPSRTLPDSDVKPPDYCDRCRTRLGRAIVPLP